MPGLASPESRPTSAHTLPPNLTKIIKRSQQETQDSRVRSRPSSSRQGFVMMEQKLRENPDYRILCAVCRRWGDRAHLESHEGATPQIRLGSASNYNCQTRTGRARISRVVETILLHLPASLPDALTVCHDTVDWVAGHIALTCTAAEPWFPIPFLQLLDDKAAQLGRQRLAVPTDGPDDIPDDDASFDHEALRREHWEASDVLKTPPIDVEGIARELLQRAETGGGNEERADTAPPQLTRRARARPGFTYDFKDATTEFYKTSRNPLGEAQQVLSSAAINAIHGPREPLLGHTPVRPATQQMTAAEALARKTVFSRPSKSSNQTPKNITPLTAPHTASLDAARRRYTLYTLTGVDDHKGANTAGRIVHRQSADSIRIAENKAALADIESDVQLAVRVYQEGRARAKSVNAVLTEGRRYGANGFKTVSAGQARRAVPDYFTDQIVPKSKALYEQYNSEYQFPATSIHEADEMLDFAEDFTGLGIGKLNRAKLQALGAIEEGVEREREEDTPTSEEAHSDSEDAAAGAQKMAHGEKNAFLYRRTIAEYVTSQLELPQYDNSIRPLAFPADAGERLAQYYSSAQQASGAAKELKAADLLAGGKFGLDPRVYQVLDASKNVFCNADLMLDSDSEGHLERRGTKRGDDGELYTCIFEDSEPSDPQAPPPEDRVEAPELAMVKQSEIYSGVVEGLKPVAAILDKPDNPLIMPDPASNLIMRQAVAAKTKLIKADAAAKAEAAAQAAKAARERANKGGDQSTSKGKKASGKTKSKATQPSALDLMSKYTVSGAPSSYENLAVEITRGVAEVRALSRDARRVTALAAAEIEPARVEEQKYVEEQRISLRTTRTFNALSEAARKAVEKTGDITAARTAGTARIAKAHLGNTVLYKEGLERYERTKLPDEEPDDHSSILTKVTLGLKPRAFDSRSPEARLIQTEEMTSRPLRKEDDGTVPLFEKTYLPINAPAHKPGFVQTTIPYVDRQRNSQSQFERVIESRAMMSQNVLPHVSDYTTAGGEPPYIPNPTSVFELATAGARGRAAVDTHTLPSRKDITDFFDDRAIISADPQTQVYKLQNLPTDSQLKCDGLLNTVRPEASLFNNNAEVTVPASTAALEKKDDIMAIGDLASSAQDIYASNPAAFQKERLLAGEFGRPAALPSVALLGKALFEERSAHIRQGLQERGIVIVEPADRPSSQGNPPLVNLAAPATRIGPDPLPRVLQKKGTKGKKGKKGKKGRKGKK